MLQLLPLYIAAEVVYLQNLLTNLSLNLTERFLLLRYHSNRLNTS